MLRQASRRVTDVVVTVPKAVWQAWIAEGDLPDEPWSGTGYGYVLGGGRPDIQPGERVYVVAWGRLRGYAPLVALQSDGNGRHVLIRAGGAVAVTVPERIDGFRGWRYAWWDRADEVPFPNWREP